MSDKLILLHLFLCVFFIFDCNNKLETSTTIIDELTYPVDSTVAFVIGSKDLGWHIGITYNYKEAYSLTSGPLDTQVRWSPDKKWVVYTKYIDEISQIWSMDYKGYNKKLLTTTNLYLDNPNISPGGNKIVFSALYDDVDHLIVIDSDGKNWQQITDDNLMNKYGISRFFRPTWSPDGNNILFNYNSNIDFSKVGLGILNIINKEITFISKIDTLLPSYAIWSPTRSEIIFEGVGYPGFQIYRANLDGSNIVKLTNSFMASFPCLSRNGEQIAYVQWEKLDDNSSAIWIMNRDGTNKYKAIDIENKLCSGPCW
jgi:Tol biopolymer transport system component